MHPYAPLDQARGYLELFDDLERWLAEITGYDAVSLQPNAGSQGEYAGLLAIRKYHASRGEPAAQVCLIPASAHGTNAASAAMAGMQVVVVACDDQRQRRPRRPEGEGGRARRPTWRALMVTYPSTHGVYEEQIREICAIVHEHGGQVYLDGANLNALVGVARPGKFGADVSHLNLHKTFCIPHGGGGPGVGPIGVRAHLAPFLPNNPLARGGRPGYGRRRDQRRAVGIGRHPADPVDVRADDGRRRAHARDARRDPRTRTTSRAGSRRTTRCSTRARTDSSRTSASSTSGPITHDTGVTVDDVAKRLIDYGFHAPTMSFPVAGTLMIEPTESEDLGELDRFVDAMIAIRAEIDRVAAGEWPADDNPLVHAPHTAEDVDRRRLDARVSA